MKNNASLYHELVIYSDGAGRKTLAKFKGSAYELVADYNFSVNSVIPAEDKARISSILRTLVGKLVKDIHIGDFRAVIHNIKSPSERYSGRRSLEIVKNGVDKLRALNDLIYHYKVDPSYVIYFGDEFYPEGNDMPILDSKVIKISSNRYYKRFEIPPGVYYIGPSPADLERFIKKFLL
jgi:hydroxymethylpyrimidine pyrophosphatase-like HAD family hydrolase